MQLGRGRSIPSLLRHWGPFLHLQGAAQQGPFTLNSHISGALIPFLSAVPQVPPQTDSAPCVLGVRGEGRRVSEPAVRGLWLLSSPSGTQAPCCRQGLGL